jgi:hypothetical protein
MARDFNKAEHSVDSLQSKITKMGAGTKIAFGGAIAMGAGAAILMSMKPAIDAAKKWETAKANFSLFGMDAAQNNEAFKFAQNMSVVGSTYVDNLHKMTEAQGAFRESGLKGDEALAGAKLAAPMLARLAVTAKAGGHEMSENDDKNLIRAIEMSGGLKDAKTFNSRADAIFKLVGSSGGQVHYEDVRAFYARGGVSAKGLTEDALMKFEPLMGEMKGTSAGTALMTSFNRLNGIVKLPNQITHELVNAGLWNGKNIEWNNQGGVKNIRSEGLLKGADLLQSDPVKWEKEILEPMYAKMGLTTQNQKNIENARLFGRTGGTLFSLMQQQAPAIDRSPEAIKKRLGVNDSYADLQKTTQGQENAVAANWQNILTNLGTAILPNVNAGLTAFNSILQKVADFTRDNPATTKFIVLGTALAGVVLVVGGAIAMFIGALSLIGVPVLAAVAGITAIGTALVWAFTSIDWAEAGREMNAGWQAIKNGFSSFFGWLGGLWSHRPTWMGGDGVVNAVPKVGENGATAADRAYYASLHGDSTDSSNAPKTPTIRTAGDKKATVIASLYLTKDGREALAESTAQHIATEGSKGTGSGNFDHGMTMGTPGMGF